MSLAPGTRLGAYEVITAIGAGGMGEVYRASDTTLGREAAIKILPGAFASDAERVARFEREAKVLAALNHPNIAAIYGMEKLSGAAGNGGTAIVMEFVEGEDLAQRLRSRVPIDEALAIAKQVADALEAAHDKGIVHRDLKPANIKLRADGTVKVLDFGLAKAVDRADGSGLLAQDDASMSPTLMSPAKTTGAGMILGTAAYMSPEQARGKAVDKRADIWAFGCVLYEMLTGRRAFARETVADTLAAVIEREPDWTALPPATPAGVRRVLTRSLEKDPKRRLRDIGDVRADLDEQAAQSVRSHAARRAVSMREVAAWTACAALAALVVVVSFTAPRGQPIASQPPTRTMILLPPDERLTTSHGFPLAIAEDGSRIAYVAETAGGAALYVRDMSALVARPLPGTARARLPFFSADGKWVGFFADGAMQKVSLAGGAPQRICPVNGLPMGASWGADDTIVWATRGAALEKVSAAGGTPTPIPASDSASWPQILPDGKRVLFSTLNAVAVIALDGSGKRLVAAPAGSNVDAPAVLGAGSLGQARLLSSGYLVYGRSQNPGAVQAIAMDPVTLATKGPAFSLADSVERGANGGGVYFAVSATGLLVYASTGERHQLVWVDRNGEVSPISADRAAFRAPTISPDGVHVAVAANDDARRSDIWIYDADRGTKRRLTTEGHNLSSTWTPDGKALTFASGRSGIVTVPRDGDGAQRMVLPIAKARPLLPPGTNPYPLSWSPDGRELLFQADNESLWVASVDGGTPRQLVDRSKNYFGRFSPDGHWIAYVSDESGQDEVYVRRYPEFVDAYAVSTAGGAVPRWSADGREMFYRNGDALMMVSVDASHGFRTSTPRALFSGRFTGVGQELSFDVSPDGRRFVMIKSDDASALQRLTVVQNWTQELKRGDSTK
jgi:Tol biopolymer transport system component/tRNA A-37 threonylcarbamoyl transferase component Bud32